MAKNFTTVDTLEDLKQRLDFSIPVYVRETSRIYHAVSNPRADVNGKCIIASIQNYMFWMTVDACTNSPLSPSVLKDPATGFYTWDKQEPSVSIAMTEDSTICLNGRLAQGVRYTLVVSGDLVNETNRMLMFNPDQFHDSGGSPLRSLTIDYASTEVFSFIAVGPNLLQLPVTEREGISRSGYSVNLVPDYWDGSPNTAPSSNTNVAISQTYTNAVPFPTKGLIRQIQTDSSPDSTFRLGAIDVDGNLVRRSGKIKVITDGNNWQSINPPFLINAGESLGFTVVAGEFKADDQTELLGFFGGPEQMDVINNASVSNPPRFATMTSMLIARPLACTALVGFTEDNAVAIDGPVTDLKLVTVSNIVESPDWFQATTGDDSTFTLTPGIYRVNFPLGLSTTATAAEATVMVDGNWKNYARGVAPTQAKQLKVRSTVNGTFNIFKGIIAAKEPITLSPRLIAKTKGVKLNSADTFIDIECLGLF